MLRNQKGFTLIELIVIIVIIGILAAVAIPNYIRFINAGGRGYSEGYLGALRRANALIFANRRSWKYRWYIHNGATLFGCPSSGSHIGSSGMRTSFTVTADP